MTERLISADDHVDMGHDAVKAHLAPKFHEAYDRGVEKFRGAMAGTASAAANARWREQAGLDAETTALVP